MLRLRFGGPGRELLPGYLLREAKRPPPEVKNPRRVVYYPLRQMKRLRLKGPRTLQRVRRPQRRVQAPRRKVEALLCPLRALGTNLSSRAQGVGEATRRLKRLV